MKIKFINPYNLICVLFLICIVGCSPDYETDFEEKTLDILNQDLAPITFDREGGEKEINVVTNVDQELWSASSNAEWCLVTKNNSSVVIRSEEHTSELQSRGHLVCRLLLEKKKQDMAAQTKIAKVL